jgi:hypothetical protein
MLHLNLTKGEMTARLSKKWTVPIGCAIAR